MKLFTWRGALIATVMTAALVYLLPTLNTQIWPHKKINLGLDLQGGMHLVLEVQTQKAVETTLERTIDEIKQELRKKDIKYLGISSGDKNTIAIELQGEESLNGLNTTVTESFNDFEVSSTSTEGDKHRIVLALPEEESMSIQKMATEQALETIRNRIDEFGVSEPDIRIQGEDRIQIQLPGVKDTKRAKALIGKTARLNFQLVDENADPEAAVKGNIPPGDELLYEMKENRITGASTKIPFLIQKRVLLD
ncbi:MAG: protein translocase subunit SecD, partial [Desulfamplus sp.]|nr:protein translocase subunit SecD [Desulfamplus sp.]